MTELDALRVAYHAIGMLARALNHAERDRRRLTERALRAEVLARFAQQDRDDYRTLVRRKVKG